MFIDLSDENLSETHNKKVTTEKGFMFHDLEGKPMMIETIEVTHWTPKQ